MLVILVKIVLKFVIIAELSFHDSSKNRVCQIESHKTLVKHN